MADRRIHHLHSRTVHVHDAVPRGKPSREERLRVTLILHPEHLVGDHPAIVKLQNLRRRAILGRPYIETRELEQLNSPAPHHITAVERFARSHDLKILEVSQARHDVVLEGSVAALEQAFGVGLEHFSHATGSYRGHHDDLTVPQELEGVLRGVIGLNDRPSFRWHVQLPRVTEHGYSPLDLADHYRFPKQLDGRGERIAILAFNGRDKDDRQRDVTSGFYREDMNEYFRDILKIPTPEITTYSVQDETNQPLKRSVLRRMTEDFNDLADTPEKLRERYDPITLANGAATLEATIDVQIAAALAPGAAIEVLFAPNTAQGYYDAIHAALGLPVAGSRVRKLDGPGPESLRRPTVVSISWGKAERSLDPEIDLIDAALNRAHRLGVTVCCSSGDYGSIDSPRPDVGEASVNYPASSKYALACGGTNIVHGKNGTVSEVVWNSAERGIHQASGGGVSGRVSRPRYQRSAEVPRNSDVNGKVWMSPRLTGDEVTRFSGRGVPDVAAYADAVPGYQTLLGGVRTAIGGTSAATPLWAALIARLAQGLGQPIGWLNRHLYGPSYRAALDKVRTGNNRIAPGEAASFAVGDGDRWDGCCGLGTPNGEALLEALRDELALAEGDEATD